MIRMQIASALSNITAQASFYDLSKSEDRARSALQLRKLFLGLIRALQPEILIEIGAYDAQTSIDARSLIKNSRIAAFEANPFNFETFKANEQLKLCEVEYVNKAVSDYVGSTTFRLQKEKGSGTVDAVSERNSLLYRADEAISYEEVTVECITVDAFLNETNGNVALWIDAEGASKQVLCGAQSTLERTSVVMIEVESFRYWRDQWMHFEVCKFLMTHNFVPVARDFEFRSQFNIVFIRDEVFEVPELIKELEYYHGVLRRSV